MTAPVRPATRSDFKVSQPMKFHQRKKGNSLRRQDLVPPNGGFTLYLFVMLFHFPLPILPICQPANSISLCQ
jgi:hypothetical protein